MKFSLQTEKLKLVCSTFSKIISKDVGEGAPGIICIEVSSNIVYFKTLQFDINCVFSETLEGSEDGKIFIPTHVLLNVVNSLLETITTLETEGTKLKIKTNSSTSEVFLPSVDEKEEIHIKKPSTSPTFSLKREVLVKGMRNVQHASAESAIKPELASVYIYTKSNSVYFVSTDGFRLAENRFLLETPPSTDDISILIPKKNTEKIIRVLDNISDPVVSLFIDDGVIYFSTDTLLIKVQSVKGVFPDYKKILPTEFSLDLIILRSDFLNFLKKARLFANSLNKLSFSLHSPTSILLEFDNETVGMTRNIIPASISGSVSSFPSFNYRFLSDVTSVISDESIRISFIDDPTKPLLLRGVEDTTLTSVISPLLEKS